MKSTPIAIIAFALLVSSEGFAQEDAAKVVANPDRPTFFAAPATVPAGAGQLEIGAQFARQDDESRLEMPLMVRTGITEYFEFRAGLPTPSIGLREADSTLGALQFSAKVAGEVNDWLALGAMPFFDIATKSGDTTIFAQSDYGALGLLAISPGDLTIGVNGGVTVGPSSDPDSELREFFYPLALAVSYGFGDFGVSVEGFGVLAEQKETALGTLLALSYRTSDTVVIDAFGATGFAGDLPDAWFGIGFTIAK